MTASFVMLIRISKGMPKPIRISKIFDPMALLIAMPDRPCFATIREENKSGMDVPTAMMIKPIKTSLIPENLEILIALSVKTQARNVMMAMEIEKEI